MKQNEYNNLNVEELLHFIYLVRMYEKELTEKITFYDPYMHSISITADTNTDDIPSIEVNAQIYIDRIKSILKDTK